MDKLTQNLIKLADYLDERGFTKAAEEVDEAIKQRWEDAAKRAPEGMGAKVTWREAFEYLKRSMISMQEAGTINIQSKDMQQFLQLINVVSEELDKKVTEHKTPTQKAVETAETVYYVSPEAVTIAENIATLSEDIGKANEKLQSGSFIGNETDEDVRKGIMEDQEKIQQNEKTLSTMATPEEIAAVQEFVNSILYGQKGSVVLVPERRQEQGRRREDQ